MADIRRQKRVKWLPRAGFEIDRKFLSSHIAEISRKLNTPSDTPHMDALDSRR